MSPTLYFVVTIWVVFLADALVPFLSLLQFGIQPRSITGLAGIIFSPFLHANFAHLISNTVPLLVLPVFAQLALPQRVVVQVMVFGGLGSGLGTWLFGSGSIVVGASGVVFALVGYLIGRACFRPNLTTILVSLLVMVTYGGAVLSLFSANPMISWAAHFWGFVSGLCIARGLRTKAQ